MSLSTEHRQYLLDKHGTIELDPIPDMNDRDPLNWPKAEVGNVVLKDFILKLTSHQKLTVLVLVAFHAMMCTFSAAAIQSTFVNISMDLHVSVQEASYLTSLVIVILGVAPLMWRPLADRYGRRPIFLISLIVSLVANVGCAKSPSYASMAVCRAIMAFFISPAGAIGTAIVAELFFKRERARYVGAWAVMITLGVPISPFIFGFVALRVNYRWIYWILAIVSIPYRHSLREANSMQTNGVQFLLYLVLGSETLYMRGSEPLQGESRLKRMSRFKRINPLPLTFYDFMRPLKLFFRPCVLLPALSYSMVFSFASVLVSIEIPQLYPEIFHFNTQEVGLQFISMLIGSLIGELIGGFLSDHWMLLRKRQTGTEPEPEYRLWLSWVAYPLAIVGVVVFLVCIGDSGKKWTVSPLIGAAIAAVGNQIVTTVLITYAIDCYRHEAAAIGVFITFVRQLWGFIGPFW